jgi:hypothetical protein
MDFGVGRFRAGIAGEGEAILPSRQTGPVIHRPESRLIPALAILALSGCGIESAPPATPPPKDPPPLEFVGGVAGINRITDAAGNARYVGELVNNSDEVACNIGVSVNSYDASDELLTNPGNQQFGFANLLGESFRFSLSSTQTVENCLSPGHQASFDIRNDFTPTRVARIEASTTCDGRLFVGCTAQDTQPFAYPVAILELDGSVTQTTTLDGKVAYIGTIRNSSTTGAAPTYHVKIVFTVRNDENVVVDVACATMDGPECPVPAGSSGTAVAFAPGDGWDFTVFTSITPDQTCPNCFSYIINQKPSP